MTEIRGFHHHSRSWWFAAYPDRDVVDMVSFGLYDDDASGGTFGEMSMTWERLGSGRVAPKLCAWDDAWHVLARCGDVVQALGARHGALLTPTDFTALLIGLGFVDRTERVRPAPRRAQGRQLITVQAAR